MTYPYFSLTLGPFPRLNPPWWLFEVSAVSSRLAPATFFVPKDGLVVSSRLSSLVSRFLACIMVHLLAVEGRYESCAILKHSRSEVHDRNPASVGTMPSRNGGWSTAIGGGCGGLEAPSRLRFSVFTRFAFMQVGGVVDFALLDKSQSGAMPLRA